jgi:hypothetical protein
MASATGGQPPGVGDLGWATSEDRGAQSLTRRDVAETSGSSARAYWRGLILILAQEETGKAGRLYVGAESP